MAKPKKTKNNICKNCNIKFIGKIPSREYKYCSQKCMGFDIVKNNINYDLIKCSECKKDLGRKKLGKNYFCNSSCQLNYEYKTGIRNKKTIAIKANEKLRKKAEERLKKGYKYFNRIISKRGYWQIYIPLHGWKNEHQYIWELHNGVQPQGFDIHHINEDKLDNRIENLKLISKSEHHKEHYEDMVICEKTGKFLSKNTEV